MHYILPPTLYPIYNLTTYMSPDKPPQKATKHQHNQNEDCTIALDCRLATNYVPPNGASTPGEILDFSCTYTNPKIPKRILFTQFHILGSQSCFQTPHMTNLNSISQNISQSLS